MRNTAKKIICTALAGVFLLGNWGIHFDAVAAEANLGQSEVLDQTPAFAAENALGSSEEISLGESFLAPAVLGFSPFSIIIINPTTVSVNTFADFKTAVEGNNGYTTIQLAANIPIGNGGVSIPASKTSLTIDGTAANYKITDYTSATTTQANTIRVPLANTATTTVTLKNLVLDGYNQYSPLSTYATTNQVTINYENITYTGPQLSFNRYGTVNIKNCNLTLIGSNSSPTVKTGAAATQCIAEAGYVAFYGTNTISHQGTLPALRMRGTPTVTFATGSNTTMNCLRTGGNAFLYTFNDTAVTLQPNSTWILNTGRGFVDSQPSRKVTTFLVGADATAKLTATNTSSHKFTITDTLQVDPGGTLDFRTPATAATGPTLQIISTGAGAKKMYFNDPERVVLYSSGTVSPIDFKTAGPFQVNTGALNFWSTTPSGTTDAMSNMPAGIWNKASGNLTMTANISATNAVSSLINNLVGTDPIVTPLNTSTFAVNNGMRMITMGRYNLTVNPVSPANYSVTGTTEASAEIAGSFTQSSTNYTASSTANASGAYSATFTTPPLNGTVVTVMNHCRMLKARQRVTSQSDFSFVHLPATINFATSTVPGVTTRIPRDGVNLSDYYVSVMDTRGGGMNWRVTALATPIVRSGDGHTLAGNFVYVSGASDYALSAAPIPLLAGTTGPTPFASNWASGEGLLLDVLGGGALSGSYTATITWNLEDVP